MLILRGVAGARISSSDASCSHACGAPVASVFAASPCNVMLSPSWSAVCASRSGKFYAAMENLQCGVVGVRRGRHARTIHRLRVVDRRGGTWLVFRQPLGEP